MREEKLLDLIGQIDCQYINEAAEPSKTSKSHWVRWCALAACLAVCIFSAFAGHNAYQEYHTVVSYVCLDVNPSFELCLNHKDHVVNAIAYNDDGKSLLDKIDYQDRHYEDVITDILHHDDFQKYLTQDFTITIVSDDATIQQNIQDHMNATNCGGKVVCTDTQTRDKAYSNHCSVGKYIAYEELAQYDQNVTLESCKEMTMHEIYEEIDRHHNEHHNQQSNTNSQNHTTPSNQEHIISDNQEHDVSDSQSSNTPHSEHHSGHH